MSNANPGPVNLLSMLEAAVAAAPSDPFVTDLRLGRSWSYDDLRRSALWHADWLRQRGVGPGDRVAFLTKNDPVFFPLLFACAMTGAILVPVNRDNLAIEIDTVLQDASPAVIVHEESWNGGRAGSVPVSWRNDDADVPAPAPQPAEDVLIIYTSGTTGNAKGVVLTQRNLATMARTFVDLYPLRPRQRFLSMLPLYHINAPMITGLVCVQARAHVHLTDPYGFTNARSIFDLVEANRINVLSLTPAIMASLIQLNPQGANRDTSSLELCFCGTAALNEALWRRFEGLFNVPVYQGYGLTETTTWATFTPPDARKRYDTAGIPLGCEVRIDGDPTGEVLIKGDIVMSAYFNKKKLTRKSIREGWYYSGDVGRFDDDGQLVIVGRTKNIIKRHGVLIHPEAIDAVLRQSGCVADCCTLGIADAAGDERVVTACVADGASLERVRALLVEKLSPYNRPDEIVAMRAIPRSAVGKPLLPKVRDWVSGEATERVIQAFNRYKYSRAPSEQLDEIRALIQAAVLAGEPLTVAGLWGVGKRGEIAEPDRIAMARLDALRREMDDALGDPHFKVLLLLADMHGKCNRIPDDRMASYFEQVAALAAGFGIETRMLGELWREAGLQQTQVERLKSDPATLEAWQAFPLRQDFLRQAENRCGCAALAEEYAFNYYCTCLAERDTLTKALKGTIFFTYNAPKHRVVLPQLPTVHLHSTKPGTTAKPWFM